MAIRTGFPRLRITVTSDTRGRVHAPVNSMPCQIVTAMRRPAKRVALILQGRLQLHPVAVTIAARIALVAHCARLFMLPRLPFMLFSEGSGVIELLPDESGASGIMALSTNGRLVSKPGNVWMLCRQSDSSLHRDTR